MKKLFSIIAVFCLFTLTFACADQPITQKKIAATKAKDVQLTVVTIPKTLNKGFELVDVASRDSGYIKKHFDQAKHQLIINGGYFDQQFLPVGLCKVNGKEISNAAAPKLSGYVVIDDQGKIDLLWKQREQALKNPTVLQSGPYIVDPGGNIGIQTQSGKLAARTILALDKQGDLLIIITNKVELHQLARILIQEFPNIDRALNLDGGPSTGFIYQNTEIENNAPVRNFIRLKYPKYPK